MRSTEKKASNSLALGEILRGYICQLECSLLLTLEFSKRYMFRQIPEYAKRGLKASLNFFGIGVRDFSNAEISVNGIPLLKKSIKGRYSRYSISDTIFARACLKGGPILR